MDGAHGLERHDVVQLGGRVERLRLVAVGAQRLLDQHVLVAAHAGECLLVVAGVGRGDVDGVDVWAVRELLERGERAVPAVLLGELAGIHGVSRQRAHVLDALDLARGRDEVVADHGRADGCEANAVCHDVSRCVDVCPPGAILWRSMPAGSGLFASGGAEKFSLIGTCAPVGLSAIVLIR